MNTFETLTLSPKRKRGTMPLSVQVADLTPPRTTSDEFGGTHATTTISHTESPRTATVTGNFKSMYLNENLETKQSNSLELHKHHHHYSPRKRLRFTPPPQEGEADSEDEILTSTLHSQSLDRLTRGEVDEAREHSPTYPRRPATPPPSNLPSLPPSPNTPSPLSTHRNLKRKKSPPPDQVTNPLTWRDSEITGHLLSDPDDDGTGINGVGFKPTPAVAYARAQKRKQQVAEWKAREARDARQKRSERRRLELKEVWEVPTESVRDDGGGGGGGIEEFEGEKRIKVRFA